MGNIRLVPSRHARNTTRIRGARATNPTKHETGEASIATILRTQAQSNRGGSQPITRRPVHPRNEEATWIANPVLVPKQDTDVLRMCVNYGTVNKHCPKDHFPLPR